MPISYFIESPWPPASQSCRHSTIGDPNGQLRRAFGDFRPSHGRQLEIVGRGEIYFQGTTARLWTPKMGASFRSMCLIMLY
jgi:hypothetical protein